MGTGSLAMSSVGLAVLICLIGCKEDALPAKSPASPELERIETVGLLKHLSTQAERLAALKKYRDAKAPPNLPSQFFQTTCVELKPSQDSIYPYRAECLIAREAVEVIFDEKGHAAMSKLGAESSFLGLFRFTGASADGAHVRLAFLEVVSTSSGSALPGDASDRANKEQENRGQE